MKDVQQMLNQQASSFKIKDDDVVICSKCEGEFFTSAIRLAKTKIDLKNEALGLIHESPVVFCAFCKERLPADLTAIKTKKDLIKAE